MAQLHGQLLKQFHITGASLSWPDVQCVCAMFPMIEDLSVLIFTNDIVSLPHHDHRFSVTEFSGQTLIDEAVMEAKNLRTLSVEVGMAGWQASRNKFSVEEAREMMMRDGSSLREIRVAGISYKVRRPSNLRHEPRLTRCGTQGHWVPVVNPEDGTTCGEFRVSQDDSGRLSGWSV